nr:Spo0E family sporulation regulatory protein-aspartic acid phosphatase [Brevibacillus formosus]
MYLEKNNLLDDEVVDLSQQLDKYILAIQLKMMKKE